jgi:hypothetical protein
MTDEKSTGIQAPVIAPVEVMTQAIPAIVDANKPVVPALTPVAVTLSQAPPIAASDAKPIVDKAGSVVAPTLTEKK